MKENRVKLNNRRFGDDVILIVNDFKEPEEMMVGLNEIGKAAGLKIKVNKTKVTLKNEIQTNILIKIKN